VAEQRQGTVADQVDRRFMAGDEQENACGEQFIFVERVASFFGRDQAREQVAAW
jgi:hypothetical protein